MIHQMSETGREMLAFQAQLAEEYGYSEIGYNIFLGDVREKYRNALPKWCNVNGDMIPCYTLSDTLIALGYNRIVIGDYGAFVEFREDQIRKERLIVKPGQEFRINDPQFSIRVKYHWLTVNDGSGIKVYFQQKTVSYADYRPGMFYVSPYELFVIK